MIRTALFALWLGAPAPRQALPRPVDPWVRYQGDITAGSTAYIPLRNPGTAPVVVRGVACENVRLVQMHETVRGGPGRTASMARRDSLVIPVGGRLEMRPGGVHLMLLGLARPLNVGEFASCTVRTSAGDVPVRAPILTAFPPSSPRATPAASR